MTNQNIKRIYDAILVNGFPACIGNPSPPKLYGTRKVIQLTGDIDRETGEKTLNETGSRFGIYGTDLGVSFLHDGKLYFLFGDTNRLRGKPGLPASAMPGEDFNETATDYDAIAYTTSDHAYEGIRLSFNRDFPHLDYVDQMTGEHPIEGISIGEYMYVFFTTDLYPEEKVPTRSIIARSNDGGIHFGKPIYTLSTDKFIHVSAEIIDNHILQGLPEKTGAGLLIWGTPKHRKSDIYLAHMQLAEITNRSSLRYFSGIAEQEEEEEQGHSKKPVWTSDESKAKPLFSAGCAGELSVRWNCYLEKWIMLYNCELCNTSGIIIRLADKPWGPWSAPRIIFDPEDGYGKFIHEPGKDNLNDPTRDGPEDKGDEYGPYQMTPYSTGIKGRYTKIYFTMSTWNPYQVMQMSAIIPSEQEQEKAPAPYADSLHDRNDRKYAYISLLFAHLAKINNVDLEKNSGQTASSSYIADHIEWAQFHSHSQLRTEIKDKFRQLISALSCDVDKAEVYAATLVAIARLTHDYSTFRNSINEQIHRKWALNAVHTGHKDWLISEIDQAVDHKHFLLSNDHLCYAYSSSDPNEFKYARLSVFLTSNLANDNSSMKKEDVQVEGLSDEWNFHIAWARFRSVNEMRQDLLKKIRQMIESLPAANSVARLYADSVKTVLELTDGSQHKDEDYSRDYEWAQSVSMKNKNEEIIQRISNLLYSDQFLIPIGQKSSK
ncbi:MAG: DUF4185 domain-containing protein [Thermoproteota archaeon]|nr:DUF4185 domain-containing protein [Thermoproteota archaeon]